MNKIITVHDSKQNGYAYELVARIGKDFSPDFSPDLTPQEMLKLGVFGGLYLNDCTKEFPTEWFAHAKLSKSGTYEKELNYFKVKASHPLEEWQRKGWIYKDDPRGWFQWYARYYMGRRIASEDERQIKRWNAMRRHIAQLRGACLPGDITCRPVQRQALLHWAYDSRKL